MDIVLTENPGNPVYRQIADQILSAIGDGRLASGARLPTIRALALELGVNRDTVSLAYELLAQRGVVEATVGRGTFVAHRTSELPKESWQPNGFSSGFSSGFGSGFDPRNGGNEDREKGSRDPQVSPPPLAAAAERLIEFERNQPQYHAPNGAIPLHALIPDPSLYPVDAFRRSINRAMSEGGTDILVYGGNQGSPELCRLIAEHLTKHGLAAQAHDVVLCHGSSQGISLALRLYAEPGDSVAVEEPTYHNVLSALTALGLKPVPIPMGEDGPNLEVLSHILGRPEVKLFYTMPSFHNPLGTTMSVAQRHRLLEVAAKAGKPVIEDAFEMDLRYDGTTVAPLAALDQHGLVVHLFSFSKSLFPGVRVGAVTTRGRAVDGLLALKHATDLSSGLILQAAVADFVRCGAYDRHLKGIRKKLRERRDATLDSLERHFPSGTSWTKPEGGYQIWVELPEGTDTRSLYGEAQRAGVLFAPGYQFNHDARASCGLRLSTALADVPEIEEGIRRLARVVDEHLSTGARRTRSTNIHV